MQSEKQRATMPARRYLLSSILYPQFSPLLANFLPNRLDRHPGAVIDDFATPFDRLCGGGQIDSIDAKLAGGDPLFHADRRRIDDHHLRGNGKGVVIALGE